MLTASKVLRLVCSPLVW